MRVSTWFRNPNSRGAFGLGAAGLMLALAFLTPQAAIRAQDAGSLYVKGATWQETMLASRAAYAQWVAQLPVTLEPWHAVGPLKANGFADALFPEQGVDLEAKAEDGKPLWTKHREWEDGQVINLPGQDGASTYLYRVIEAKAPAKLPVSLGSDDGIEVWLNGAKILSQDVPRGVAPDQAQVELDLVAGKNQVLMKIHNQTGGHGFYFSTRFDSVRPLWDRIAADFPVGANWVKQDTPEGLHLAWFSNDQNADMSKKLLGHVVKDINQPDSPLAKETDALVQSQTPPEDPRWLAQYAKACRVRDALRDLDSVNMDALCRAVDDLTATFPEQYANGGDFKNRAHAFAAELPAIRQALAGGDDAARAQAMDKAKAIVALRADALLANPLLDFDRLLLIKRGQGNLGLPQNWQGNCAVAAAGYDNEIAVLSPVRPGGQLTTFYKPENNGFVGDVDLNFDADKMLFSMPGSHGRWQIWEIGADGANLRQVTTGEEPDVNNYDACYLPDGRIVFASTRCFQGIPCVGGADAVANLCIMNADGSGIRQLCFDQDHNWCPTLLNNGRVMYSRWEYSDTPHYFSRLLFSMNPDGTNQMEYYGSNSFWPNSIFYARPIPNHPTQVVTIVSGHHGVPRMGELIILDPAKGRHEGDGVVQRIPGYGQKVEPVIADQLVQDSWPRFLHPYPLSDKYFLASCQVNPDKPWSLYLVDIFDNMLPLCEIPGFALFEPVPFRATQRPPALPDRVKPEDREATVYLADIYQGGGLKDVPRGTVKSLRLYEFYYTYPNMGGHQHIGMEGPWDIHRILGTVPVLDDGSAVFKVPANTPIAVQPLDGEGKALQIMRSWFAAMPGEVLSCVGCHEKQNSAVPVRRTLAMQQAPVAITPWYGPARGFSFKREVQPVLDKYCVGCHNGGNDKVPDFSSKPENGWGGFTPSYLALHPYVRRPGPESDYHLPTPLEYHADTSVLVQMLKRGHKGVEMDAEAWDRLITWIDLNVPDHGTWAEQAPIPGGFHERRREMLTKYANRPEDPEVIPAIERGPVEFVQPGPAGAPSELVACPNWPLNADQAKQLQAAASADGQTIQLDLGNGVTMEFVRVPAGQFVMGGAAVRPQCAVMIDKPFWMGTSEVTTTQFMQFDPAHENGVLDQHNKDHTTRGYPADGPNQPAMRVSWNEANAFCQWLSQKSGRACALPTEAQWEWACRAGTDTPMNYGGFDADFGTFANMADASIKLLAVAGINPQPIENPDQFMDFLPKDPRSDDGQRLMCDVKQYQPNTWGLYDMHGNVWEWTLSNYKPYPYNDGDGRNDLSPTENKVVRGGSWSDKPKWSASYCRLPYRTYQKVFNVGFRVVIVDGEAVKVAAK